MPISNKNLLHTLINTTFSESKKLRWAFLKQLLVNIHTPQSPPRQALEKENIVYAEIKGPFGKIPFTFIKMNFLTFVKNWPYSINFPIHCYVFSNNIKSASTSSTRTSLSSVLSKPVLFNPLGFRHHFELTISSTKLSAATTLFSVRTTVVGLPQEPPRESLAVWLSGLSMVPCSKRSLVRFLIRAHARVAGPSRGLAGDGQSMFLSLFPSLFLFL